jgi:hypothetical protein
VKNRCKEQQINVTTKSGHRMCKRTTRRLLWIPLNDKLGKGVAWRECWKNLRRARSYHTHDSCSANLVPAKKQNWRKNKASRLVSSSLPSPPPQSEYFRTSTIVSRRKYTKYKIILSFACCCALPVAHYQSRSTIFNFFSFFGFIYIMSMSTLILN